jgi:hypothetical protein
MSVRHVVKIEWIGGCDSRSDADLFNPKQNEYAPKHIKQLHGNEKDPQRNGLPHSLCRKARPVMTYEHLISPFQLGVHFH